MKGSAITTRSLAASAMAVALLCALPLLLCGCDDRPSVVEGFVRDGDVYVRIEGGTLYRSSCDPVRVEQLSDGEWTPYGRLESDAAGGVYLDGMYLPALPSGLGFGCDVVSCDAYRHELRVARASAPVLTGTKPPPDDALEQWGIEPEGPADVFETRPFVGTLRITLRFSVDSSCDHPKEASLEVEVPGPEACASAARDASCAADGG